MKAKVIAAVFGVLLFSTLMKAQRSERGALDVVPTVDLMKYSGVWYEIARLPNRFEESCAGDISATYTVLSKNRLKVVNRCRKLSTRAGLIFPGGRSLVKLAMTLLALQINHWPDWLSLELLITHPLCQPLFSFE